MKVISRYEDVKVCAEMRLRVGRELYCFKSDGFSVHYHRQLGIS